MSPCNRERPRRYGGATLPDDVRVRELPGDAWQRRAGRSRQLTSDQWSTPTCCEDRMCARWPDDAVDWFTRCAQIVRETPMSDRTVIGGVRPSDDALAVTRDLLVRIPDPATMIEVLAGRAMPGAVIAVIR